jgi:hypothetical protein
MPLGLLSDKRIVLQSADWFGCGHHKAMRVVIPSSNYVFGHRMFHQRSTVFTLRPRPSHWTAAGSPSFVFALIDKRVGTKGKAGSDQLLMVRPPCGVCMSLMKLPNAATTRALLHSQGPHARSSHHIIARALPYLVSLPCSRGKGDIIGNRDRRKQKREI